MMLAVHQRYGAVLAPDGIPLHYGDQAAELAAAREAAALLDRSHEGRLSLTGRDRLALLQRMSTNDVAALQPGQGAPTLLTTPTGRIIDRIMVYNRGDDVLVLTEPGRGEAVRAYLQRNIFFNDELFLRDLAGETRLFAVHGPHADAILHRLVPDWPTDAPFPGREAVIAGTGVFIGRIKPVSQAAWGVIAASETAPAVYDALVEAGARPAGSLTYNVLRIAAGRPGVGRELSADYIPLEVGLWDEVSFTKGCYTGQEIIARMESRGKLAKTIVQIALSASVDAPAPLYAESGRQVGTLTSSVSAPDGQHYGIGVVNLTFAEPGLALTAGAGVPARILRRAGVQRADLSADD